MSTESKERVESRRGVAHESELRLRPSRLFLLTAVLAFAVGGFSVLGGIGGAVYTYRSAAEENITTPGDAAIADAPVRGPLTLWAQADIIEQHQLESTEGHRYAEMDREDPLRGSWIDATALTTALGLGILSYAFSAFAIAMGVTVIALGLVVLRLRHTASALA